MYLFIMDNANLLERHGHKLYSFYIAHCIKLKQITTG
jgi:hypothetical protein